MTRIVSSLPGRIRVRDKSLRDQEKLNELKHALVEMKVIYDIQDNVRTGSVLVRFDRNAVELSDIAADIDSATDKIIGKSSPPHALQSKKNINRYNKIAMLVTLGASLIPLATTARRKYRRRWHALAGYAFIANLGVHLYIYRKSLIRLFR